MRLPHFVRLAEIDELRFISACRQGMVHLIWDRASLRLDREEFRRLAKLLEQAADPRPHALARDGDLRVTTGPDRERGLQIGSLTLSLSPVEFGQLLRAVREAGDRLAELLAGGGWDREEPEQSPPDPLDPLRRTLFSDN